MRRKKKELLRPDQVVVLTPEETEARVQVLLGYTHISGIPLCSCQDPGNYAALLCPYTTQPLFCVLKCWCGNTARLKFDDMMERALFIENKGQ